MISFVSGELLLLKMDSGELGVYSVIVYALIPMLAALYAQRRLSPIADDQWFYSSQMIFLRALKVVFWFTCDAMFNPKYLGYLQVTTAMISNLTMYSFLQPFRGNMVRNVI
jgi:hypothetical protein